jgi:peptide-methionine (S)-S-oxide reductase
MGALGRPTGRFLLIGISMLHHSAGLLVSSRWGIVTPALLALLATGAAAGRVSAQAEGAGLDTATFAGGCFWCMVHPFDQLPGVVSVTSGYTGGTLDHPTYQQVSSGGTGHVESVQILYDPQKIGYDRLLDVFWHNVDPLDGAGQFCDRGEQYRSEIFYHGATQQQLAEASKARLTAAGHLGDSIVTRIVSATRFYPAEDYHQDYYKKSPLSYKFYRWNCGRDARLTKVWGSAAGHGTGAGAGPTSGG